MSERRACKRSYGKQSKETHHCEPVVSETPLERARFDMISDVILWHSVRVSLVCSGRRLDGRAIVQSATHTHCKIKTSRVSHRALKVKTANGYVQQMVPKWRQSELTKQRSRSVWRSRTKRTARNAKISSPIKMQVKATRTF